MLFPLGGAQTPPQGLAPDPDPLSTTGGWSPVQEYQGNVGNTCAGGGGVGGSEGTRLLHPPITT